MQITLKQAELEDAVRGYMTRLGIGAEITDISFTATRGSEGIVTTLELGGKTVSSTSTPQEIAIAKPAPSQEKDEASKMLEEAEAILGGPVTFAEDESATEESEEVLPPSGKSLFD